MSVTICISLVLYSSTPHLFLCYKLLEVHIFNMIVFDECKCHYASTLKIFQQNYRVCFIYPLAKFYSTSRQINPVVTYICLNIFSDSVSLQTHTPPPQAYNLLVLVRNLEWEISNSVYNCTSVLHR